MKPITKKFFQWLPFPALWVTIWSVAAYHQSTDADGGQPHDLAQQFGLVRSALFLWVSFLIGILRHHFLSTARLPFRRIPLTASARDLAIFTDHPWSRYLPEVVTGVLYIASAWLLSKFCSSLLIFPTSLSFLCFSELAVQYGAMAGNLGNSQHRQSAQLDHFDGPSADDCSEDLGQEPTGETTERDDNLSSKTAAADSLTTKDQPITELSAQPTSEKADLENESLLLSVSKIQCTVDEDQLDQEEENWRAQLTVFDQQSGQQSQRWVWIHRWSPSESKGEIHLQFCPFFQDVPQVAVEVVDGPGEAQIKKTLVQGIHLTLKRSSLQTDTTTTLIVTASSPL